LFFGRFFDASHRCREIFDFSDHVVLFVVQYICVVSLEQVAVVLQPTASKTQQLAVFISATAITVVSLWYMAMTTAYFHTRLETVVGFALAFGFCFALFGGLHLASERPGKLRRIASQVFSI
jgi:hypothetical protein